MNYFNYKRITHVLTIALIITISAFAVSGVVFAQTVTAVPSGGDDTISITARVIGCGDGDVQTGLGEQCDGSDLNSQSCLSIGFDSGTLSCRPSCIFETSLCVNDTGGGNGDSGGGSVRDVDDIFNNNTPDTNVVFTGQGEPNSNFFVTTPGGYFISVPVDSQGNFSVSVSEPIPGDYSFTFYTLSPNGLFGPKKFSTPIQQYATTYINNIFIPYEIVEPLVTEPEIPIVLDTSGDDIPNIDNEINPNPNPIDGNLYKEFLDVLAQSENLSPEELRELIKVFSEQHGYEAKVPGYTQDGVRLGLLPYMQRQWMKIPEIGRKWYPNVYLSFLEPYRIFFYELTRWYNEINNPVTKYII